MTASEFLAKYPDTERRSNTLIGMACPNCGQRDELKIAASIIALVSDDGTDRDESDCEWSPSSYCECPQCDHTGVVAHFTIDGLDAWDESEEEETNA